MVDKDRSQLQEGENLEEEKCGMPGYGGRLSERSTREPATT